MNPVHPKVSQAADFVSTQLNKADMFFKIETDDDEPNFYAFAARDKYGYINVGMIVLDTENDKALFLAEIEWIKNHNLAEGITSEESKHWRDCQTASIFLLHLTGGMRQLQREKMKKEVDK